MLLASRFHRSMVLGVLGGGLAASACSSPGNDASSSSSGAGTGGSAVVTPPVGKQLLVGGALTLREMTSDGWIVYSDNDTLNLHAAPLAGGAARPIVALGDSFAVSNWFTVVFAWSNKNTAGVGPLTVWSSAASGPRQVSNASLAPWVAAASDGSAILYLDNVDSSGATGDLYVAAGDGSSPEKLLSGLGGLSTSGCATLLGFAGSTAIAAHCDGTSTSVTISAFAEPGWTRTDLVTGAADAWVTDPSNTMLLTATSAGTIVVPLAGGTPTVIDATGGTAQFIANGADAIYGTSSNALRRSPVSSPMPVTLVASGVTRLDALSGDGNHAMYYSKMDPVHLVSDLYLTSAMTPGTPVTLSSSETAGVFGDAFTTDSSHALYFTSVDTMTQTGTLNAIPVAGGSPAALSTSAAEVWAGVGSRVVFGDNYMWTGSRGHVDVRTVDTAGTAAPTLIVNQADSEIFLSPARDQVVYTWSLDASSRAGIYVVALPTGSGS